MPPSAPIRVVYVLALLAVFSPVALASLVGLARGVGGLGPAPLLLLAPTVLLMALALVRIAQVLRNGRRLAAPREDGATRWIRRLGVLLMSVGVVAFVGQFLAAPIGLALLGSRPSAPGISALVAGAWFAIVGGLAPIGILLFEVSRLADFERQMLRVSR